MSNEPKPIPGPSPGPSPDRPVQPPAVKPGPASAVKRPAVTPGAKPNPARRVYVAKSSGREILIAIGLAIGVLALVVWGIIVLGKQQGKPSRNFLSGVIVAKHDIGEREQLVGVSSKGVNIKQGDTGYSFDVKVEPEGRIYEVPVVKKVYDYKKVGDRQDFIRPKSEQW